MSGLPSLTVRTRFPRDVDLANVLLTSKTIWPLEVPSFGSDCIHQNPESGNARVSLPIPKPSGQVSEVNKGGYSLPKVLGWESKRYRAVQAGVVLIFFRATLDILHLGCHSRRSKIDARYRENLQKAKEGSNIVRVSNRTSSILIAKYSLVTVSCIDCSEI
jgi:hypothetical protein